MRAKERSQKPYLFESSWYDGYLKMDRIESTLVRGQIKKLIQMSDAYIVFTEVKNEILFFFVSVYELDNILLLY